MKSSFRITALATLVAALASLYPAMHAQTTLNGSVNVPFSFDYGTKHFAPGAYTLTMYSHDCLIVRSSRSHYGTMALVRTDFELTGPEVSQVTFRKYGDRYFLEEVLATDGEHITVIESKQ